MRLTLFNLSFLFLACIVLFSQDDKDLNQIDRLQELHVFSNPYSSIGQSLSKKVPFDSLESRMITLLEDQLDIDFVKHAEIGTGDVVSALESGQCALLPVWYQPSSLSDLVNYSSVFAEAPAGFITSVYRESDFDLDEFHISERIAVITNSPSEKYLKQNYIGSHELLYVDSLEEGLQAVSFGQADAYLGNLVQSSNYIREYGVSLLDLADEAVFTIPYRFAVSRRYPALFEQIQELIGETGVLKPEITLLSAQTDSASPEERGEIDRPLLVKGDYAYPPYEYLNENDQPTGFNVDIMRAVADVVGLNIDIQLDLWDKVRDELETGQIDALMGMFNTIERQKKVDFSVPHFVASYAIFVRKDSTIQSMNDLYDKSVIVMKSDLGFDFMMTNQIAERLILCDTSEEVMESLNRGLGDAAILSRLQGVVIKKEKNLKNIIITGPPVLKRDYSIAVPKGEVELLALINEGLNQLKITGEYQKIYSKWFGVYDLEDLKDYSSTIRYIAAALLCIAILLVISIFWNRFLRRLIDRKTSELQKSGEQLRVTLASIAEAVITTDTDGLVTSMNHTASKLTGCNEADIIGCPLEDVFRIINDQTREKVENLIGKVLESNKPVKQDYPVVLQSETGEEWLIDDSAAPIRTEKGDVIGVVLVFRNITEEYRMREKLQQSQKMRAVGELAGGVAHDFNNMLGGIMGGAELLAHYIEKDSKQAQFLDLILTSSRRAADLTKKLLLFARHDSSDMVMIDIHSPLREALALFVHTADPRIQLHQDFNESPLMINGDLSQLQNAFLNLLINSSHAMPDGGDIWIASRQIEITTHMVTTLDISLKPGGFTEIEIRDNGCGIPKAIQDRIFEPFFTTRKQGEGTGLGLAAVFGTVKQHEGLISVYSEIGEGTVFKLLFPLTDRISLSSHEKKDEYKGHNETVLVVDDEPAMRQAAMGMLELMDFNVIQAENGLEALDVFRRNSSLIQLVLLDMTMPGMNGKDCFRELRNLDKDIKVIISSGFTLSEDIMAMKKKGLNGFIRKPYQYNELNREIGKVMDEIPGRLPE